MRKLFSTALLTLTFVVIAFSQSTSQILSDITKNGGSITVQFPNKNPKEGEANLIDGNIDNKYVVPFQKEIWIQYNSPVAVAVNQYTITSANDMPGRDPKSWTLQGSNDATTWIDLDKKEGQSFAKRFETKTFSFVNKKTYKSYRLNIINNGDLLTQLSKWGLFQVK